MKIKHYAMIATALVAGVVLFTECASMRIAYRRLPARAKTFVETFFRANVASMPNGIATTDAGSTR